jgi:hypothetical protein
MAAAASLYDVTIGVSNEIGDSSVDCQNYIAFVIEVVGTLGLSRHELKGLPGRWDLFAASV